MKLQRNESVLYQHDKVQKKKNTPSCLLKLSSIIANGLESLFYWLGCKIGKFPVITIIVCVIIIGAFVSGIVFFREETRPGNLWVPSNSLAKDHDKWIDQNYPSDFLRLQFVLIEADNVLHPNTLNAILEIDQKIKAIDLNQGINWENLCARLGPTCWSTGILELWHFNETLISNLTSTDIIEEVNSTQFSPVYGTLFDVDKYLGGIVRDVNGKVISAKAAIFQYVLRSNDSLENEEKEGNIIARLWEEKLIEVLEKDHRGVTKIFYNMQRSNADVGTGAIFGDLEILFIGFVLIILFVTLALGKFNFVHQRVFIALSGVLCVGLSVGVSIGLCSYADIFFGPLHNILPFLLLGIGVDDMFVIVQSYEVQKEKIKDLPVFEQTGHVLKAAGVSITVTSLTDIAAFGVGATTKIPALSSFCIYACVGILAIYLLTATFFVACLTLDNYRATGNRNACCCCYVHKAGYKPNKCSQKEFVQTFFDKYYGYILTKWPIQALVLFITAGLLAFGIYGVVNVKQDFDPNWFIPSGNYLKDYLDANTQYFPDDGKPAYLYIGQVDYPGNLTRLVQLHNDINALDGIYTGSVDSWYYYYYQWLQTSQNVLVQTRTSLNNSERLPITDRDFYDLLDVYLYGEASSGSRGPGARFIRDIVFNDTTRDTVPKHIRISKALFKHTYFDDAKAEIKAMKAVRKVLEQTGFKDIYAFTRFYLIWEGNDVIQTELYRNIGLAFLCVFVMTFILIAHPWTCILVSSCIIASVVDVGGLIYWWGLTIDTVTSINTILAVGLAIDYAAHIGHTFMTVSGNRKDRTILTMSRMGPAVLYGGFSTFLAFILLAGSTSYVFRVFFRVFLGVVVFGLFHGMVYLPVILCLVGPAPYLTESDEKSPSIDQFNDVITPELIQPQKYASNSHPEPKVPGYSNGSIPNVEKVKPEEELGSGIGSILGTDNQVFDEYSKVNKNTKNVNSETNDTEERLDWQWIDETPQPQAQPQKWTYTLPIKTNWNQTQTMYPNWNVPWRPYPSYFTIGAKPRHAGIPTSRWKGVNPNTQQFQPHQQQYSQQYITPVRHSNDKGWKKIGRSNKYKPRGEFEKSRQQGGPIVYNNNIQYGSNNKGYVGYPKAPVFNNIYSQNKFYI